MRITLDSKDVEHAMLDYLKNILKLPYEYTVSWNDYVRPMTFDIKPVEEPVGEESDDEEM